VVAREGVGYTLEAKGELDAALEAFRAMQPDEGGPRREYALYHEGRILSAQGKKDEAKAAFEKALEKAKEVTSTLQPMIEVRLAQVDAPAVVMAEPKKEEPQTPEEPKPDEPKPDEPKPDAPKPDAPKPDAPKEPANP